VFFDFEVGFVVEDGVEDVGGFSDGGWDDSGAVLGVSVGGPGVDGGTGAGEVSAQSSCGRGFDGDGESLSVG